MDRRAEGPPYTLQRPQPQPDPNPASRLAAGPVRDPSIAEGDGGDLPVGVLSVWFRSCRLASRGRSCRAVRIGLREPVCYLRSTATGNRRTEGLWRSW